MINKGIEMDAGIVIHRVIHILWETLWITQNRGKRVIKSVEFCIIYIDFKRKNRFWNVSNVDNFVDNSIYKIPKKGFDGWKWLISGILSQKHFKSISNLRKQLIIS